MIIVIVDLNIKLDGHKIGFFQQSLNYYAERNDEHKYLFLANTEIKKQLEIPNSAKTEVHFLSQDQENNLSLKTRNVFKFYEQWKIIHEFALTNKADLLILLEMDLYQIFIPFNTKPYRISGIWFRPYMRMISDNESLKSRLRYFSDKFKKALTFSLSLLNTKWQSIFILNDEAQPLKMKHVCQAVKYLPDPVFEYAKDENFDLKSAYNLPKDKLVFLQFGFIDDRKNTHNILSAISLLPVNVQEKIAVIIVGKFQAGFEETLSQFKNQHYTLCLKDEFVSNEEMEATFAQSDVILRMNHRFSGSSGIVGIAARHNKICVLSDFGVMADQAKKYKLGYLENPDNVLGISKIISNLVAKPALRITSGQKYLKDHSLAMFAETLIQ